MIERALYYSVAAVVVISMLAATLPRLIPAIAIIVALVVVVRLVFFFTERDRW